MDLTDAYENVKKYERTIELDENGIIVTDIIESDTEVSVKYPLHTLVEPKADGEKVTVKRDNCELTIEAVSGDLKLKEIKDEYDVDLNAEVPKEYQVTMPQQYHIYYEAPKSKHHRIALRFDVKSLY